MSTITILKRSDLPYNIPLVCLRGDSLVSPWYTHQDSSEVAINLTGATISGLGYLSDDTAVTLTVERVDASGKWRINTPPTTTLAWPKGDGRYDVSLTFTDGIKTTYISGTLAVSEGNI